MTTHINTKKTIIEIQHLIVLLRNSNGSPKDGGLVSRVRHANSHPSTNKDLTKGSCWSIADEWCMCTPSLAIDTILTSGDTYFWLVKLKDVGKYATKGGLVDMGKPTEEAVVRELKEEMNAY